MVAGNIKRKRGFALILAIVAMSFMVMLTLALSSIISAKLRLATAQKQARIARQNALLGMSAAISELQFTLGKDNAVSFSSALLDTTADTPKIDGVKTPYVVGVMDIEKDVSNMDAGEVQRLYTKSVDALKNGGSSERFSWLISSEKRMKNPMGEEVGDLSDETVKLAEYKTLEEYPSEYGGKISAAQKSAKVEVLAGKVPLAGDGKGGGEGAYAWWVSDESQKAKINLARPEKYLEEDMGDARDAEAPADSRVPQIVNTSFIDEFSGLGLNPFLQNFDKSLSDSLSKISVLGEAGLADKNLADWGRDNFNDYTAVSVGIPADVSQGRLKADLTAYLQGGYGLDDSEPIARGSGKKSDKHYTGMDFGIANYSENLPTFGLLKGFASAAEGRTDFADEVEPTAHVFDQGRRQEYGVGPHVILAQWIMLPCYEKVAGADLYSMKAGGKIKLGFMLWPKIVLWNPHNVSLKSSDYVIRLYMPYRLEMSGLSSNTNSPYLSTTWVKWTYDKTKKQWTAKTYKEWAFNVYEGLTKNNGHFSEFIKDRDDNKMPVMNFQVKGLALRPGESVELRPKYSAGLNRYRDGSPSEIAGSSSNLLVAGKLALEDGTSTGNWGMNKGLGFFIETDVELTAQGAAEITDEFVYDADEHAWIKEDDVKYVAFNHSTKNGLSSSQRKYFTTKDTGVFHDAPIFTTSRAYNDKHVFRLVAGDPPNAARDGYARAGYELLLNRGGLKRLVKHDLTEWDGSSLSTYNLSSGRIKTHNYYQQDSASVFDPGSTKGDLDQLLTSRAVFLDAEKLHLAKLGRNATGTNPDAGTFAMGFESNYSLKTDTHCLSGAAFLLGFRNFHTGTLTNLVLSAHNIRAGGVKNPDLSDSSVIRRSARSNHSLGAKFSRNAVSIDQFLGNMTGKEPGLDYSFNGYYSWDLSGAYSIPNSHISESSNKTLLKMYSGGASDSQTGGRFSMYSYLSGDRGYKYDAPIAAPFDLPRDKNDLMSLAAFSHANLSPMYWQPANAFANSFASPYIDRDKIVDKDAYQINPNELIDISYILNASMWDRFYLSTIPQKEAFNERAGMRLPNTRLFLTSVPREKRELRGSDDAFENSAKYVGIDGAFNVNSVSYEAWRAVLGGMLGSKKKTLDPSAKWVNDDVKNSDDPDKFKMPNPGDFMPLSAPEENQYLSFVDNSVGRRVCESEIDLLAREIVAEVKRRAPFFSLADFVNRRLEKYESGADSESMNKRYMGLMGTLAAAIKRAEQSPSHPKNFFNSPELDPSSNLKAIPPQADSLKKVSLVSTTSTITAYDNIKGDRNHWKDLGEQVKKNEPQYIEHALQAPIAPDTFMNRAQGAPGMLSQADLLSEIGSFITVRGDTFIVRAYGEAKNAMSGDTSKAYCEAVVQRTASPVDPTDDAVAPENPFGRRFKIVSFRWLTPAEL